eukprot:1916254-Amphidinium_carterae.1
MAALERPRAAATAVSSKYGSNVCLTSSSWNITSSGTLARFASGTPGAKDTISLNQDVSDSSVTGCSKAIGTDSQSSDSSSDCL